MRPQFPAIKTACILVSQNAVEQLMWALRDKVLYFARLLVN